MREHDKAMIPLLVLAMFMGMTSPHPWLGKVQVAVTVFVLTIKVGIYLLERD